MMIAAALSGGASVLDASLPAGVASGMGNPITAAIAKPLADAIVDYDLGPRVQGLAGTVMASFGVAAGAASGNVLLTGLSLDQMYAQASMAVFGTPTATALNRGLQEGLGLSPVGAAMGEMALTMGAAAGPAVVSALRSRAVPSMDGGTASFANSGVLKQTGARQVLDPNSVKAWDVVEDAYGAIRNDPTDIATIARNTGWTEARISRVKDHVFFKEHQLDAGVRRFDADPDMLNSWSRLTKGDFVRSDMNLLRHEIFESKFEGIFKTNYVDAHRAAIKAGRIWTPE